MQLMTYRGEREREREMINNSNKSRKGIISFIRVKTQLQRLKLQSTVIEFERVDYEEALQYLVAKDDK